MANLTSFDLNLLRVLDALLHERSTVRAGERLGLSQPAVSAALARLRTALGDDLLFRRGQGMEPTQFALSLETPLREILDRVEALIQAPEPFDPTTSTAGFRISGSDFFAEMLMPTLADQLLTRAPGMRVHLVDLVPDSYVDTLERYEVDIAMIPKTELPDWTDSTHLFTSTFSVIARTSHPDLQRAGLSAGDIVPIDLFCALGHVLFSPEGRATAMGDAALAQVGRKRRVLMSLPVFSGVYRAVAGSDMVALLPTSLAHRVAASAGFEVFQPPMPITPAEITMIWHRRYTADPPHIWMRQQIIDALAPLRKSTPPAE